MHEMTSSSFQFSKSLNIAIQPAVSVMVADDQ